VPQLDEIQSLFHRAVLTADTSRLVSLLCGGRFPEKRFAVHKRHYETSLVTTILAKFPGTAWLAGTRFLTEAATRFVHECPPATPCIAEYGRGFPKFLSACPAAERMPYLHDFAELEWCVGQVAIAVDEPPVSATQMSTISPDTLPDTLLTLQPGVCYLQVSWPVDELIKLYLKDSAPDHFAMDPLDISLELQGARGEFHINRLAVAEFMFRKSISQRRSIEDAAERALELEAAFDPGQALAALIAAGLITAVTQGAEGSKT